MTDTICAIITAPVRAAVGVIRISGGESFEIVSKLFSASSKLAPNKAVYGTLKYNGEVLDSCIVTYFKAPHSYTGEDVLEISCHGSVGVLSAVIKALIDMGARQAAGGEFTKRAFLNGKLDLTRAEAVMEIIDSTTDLERKAASAHLGGKTFKAIEDIRNNMLDIASSLSAFVDYPDEDIEELSYNNIEEALIKAKSEADRLYEASLCGRVIKEGVHCAILGRTNAGKSSLMNLLSGFKRSIVTDIEGTTRDIVEQTVEIGGVKLILSDTAGLRSTENEVEKIGIEMSMDAAKSASLCLCVFDLSRELCEEDYKLEELTKDALRIAVFNKTDLEIKADIKELEEKFEHKMYISAKNGGDTGELASIINKLYLSGLPQDGNAILSLRQQSQLKIMCGELKEALDALRLGYTLDAVGICIDNVIAAAGEITGRSVTEDTVHRIFERFCVGK